jgi:ribonuclease T2
MSRFQRLPHLFLAGLLCVSPVGLARHPPHGDEPGQFDYYLLTLSWCPAHCDFQQCRGQGNGFVLHGLWPQFDSGSYPQYCAADPRLPAAAESVGMTLYRSPGLMQHEWQRHGTCTGLDPVAYFRTAERALSEVRIPPPFTAPPGNLTMTRSQIVAQFRAANPGMPENSLKLACSHGELSEVRICLNRDLTFRPCGRIRNSCPPTPVRVPGSCN